MGHQLISLLSSGVSSQPGALIFKGEINAASDFPTLAEVKNGWMYIIKTNVTDNDPTKTNTGQSFIAGDEIAWNGTDWTELGSEDIFKRVGTTISPVVSGDNLDMGTGSIYTTFLISSSSLTITSSTNEDINLTPQGTGILSINSNVNLNGYSIDTPFIDSSSVLDINSAGYINLGSLLGKISIIAGNNYNIELSTGGTGVIKLLSTASNFESEYDFKLKTLTNTHTGIIFANSSDDSVLVVDTDNKRIGIRHENPEELIHALSETNGERAAIKADASIDDPNTHAVLMASIGFTGGGDAYSHYSISTVRSFACGIDNSDSDTYKITTSADATATPSSGTTLLSLDTSGNLGLIQITLGNLLLSNSASPSTPSAGKIVMFVNGSGELRALNSSGNDVIIL